MIGEQWIRGQGIHPRKKLEDWSAKDEEKVFHAIRDVMADMTEQIRRRCIWAGLFTIVLCASHRRPESEGYALIGVKTGREPIPNFTLAGKRPPCYNVFSIKSIAKYCYMGRGREI